MAKRLLHVPQLLVSYSSSRIELHAVLANKIPPPCGGCHKVAFRSSRRNRHRARRRKRTNVIPHSECVKGAG